MRTRRMVLAAGWTVLGGALTWGAVYVDVETGGGTFTVELDAGARNGGAAFLGLAEGWTDWVDPESGEPRSGERYFEGTTIGWAPKDAEGDIVLLGNLGRRFTAADGGMNWNNGAGVELYDDVAGPTGLAPRRVAMVQQNGPHSIDGCWAVMLKDADIYFGGQWSPVGTVVSNWGVVEALAGRSVDANGWLEVPADVTGMRVHGNAGEIAAWREEAETQGKFPSVQWTEARATTNGMRWPVPGKSHFEAMTTENLTGAWTNQDYWNEGATYDAGWRDFGLTGNTGFAGGSFVSVAYPHLGGPTVTGMYSFRVEWAMGGARTNEVYQYDLDIGANTGLVRQLDWETQSMELSSASCSNIVVGRRGAHSMGVSFVISDWWSVPYYWLGEAEEGAGRGRFRMWDFGSEAWGEWMGKGE